MCSMLQAPNSGGGGEQVMMMMWTHLKRGKLLIQKLELCGGVGAANHGAAASHGQTGGKFFFGLGFASSDESRSPTEPPLK